MTQHRLGPPRCQYTQSMEQMNEYFGTITGQSEF